MIDLNLQVDDFLCRVLRNERAPWSELGSTPDLDRFLARCEYHGVTSLVFHAMREKEEWREWPSTIRSSIEEVSRGQVAQELLRAHYLRQLLTGLSGSGIPCLIIKGEALAKTVYSIPGTRSRADSDVFIDIADIGNARQAIEDKGFSVVSPIYKSHQFVVRQAGEASTSFDIDVHWRILNAPQFARTLSFAEAYSQSVEVPDLDSARTLGRVDSLLLACMHRAGSAWHDANRLIWIYDIHLMVEQMNPAELVAFSEKAVNLNVQAVCHEGLNKSRMLFGTLISDPVAERLAVPQNSGLAKKFARSNLALLLDDWRALHNSNARGGLLHELFLPDSETLLQKYRKRRHWWLPLLYLRHAVGGLANRISLK